jgi:hypothetical protein
MNRLAILRPVLALALVACGAMFPHPAHAAKEPARYGKSLSEWIALLKDQDVGVRNNAASVLSLFGPEAAPAAPALAKALTDKNPDVRRHAALALGNIGPKAKAAAAALRAAA